MKQNKLFFLISALPFILFFLGYFSCTLLFDNQTYSTPNLIGMNIHDAMIATAPMHINIAISHQKECSGIKPGTIISQKPIPNRRIKAHQSIMITISKEPSKTLTPDFSVLPIDEIKKTCKRLQIDLKMYSLKSHMPSGCFLGQFVAPKLPIAQNQIIIYQATKEPELFIVPNFINQPIHNVINALKQQQIPFEIKPINQNKHYTDDTLVVGQTPTQGSIINIKQPIIFQLYTH